ncbi:MAG: hypothetical protein CMM27_10710 [Rhodospirillaceae bacterium]|nr:hypothetical protein [Rhodospirillaceae bacterium]|tara:strand:- start:17723 stop:18091 length:369 start_codon:yes stop_codon:yes gene_type:complete
MSTRSFTGSEGNIYDAAADIAYLEGEVAYVMAILGMDLDSFDSTTVDDIVSATRDMFPFTSLTQVLSPMVNKDGSIVLRDNPDLRVGRAYHSAAEMMLNNKREMLQEAVRRHFRLLKLAEAA